MTDETISMRRVTRPYELLVRLCNPRDASEHVGIQYTLGTWNVINDVWQFVGETVIPIDSADKDGLAAIVGTQYTELLVSQDIVQKEKDDLIAKHESDGGTVEQLENAKAQIADLQAQLAKSQSDLGAALTYIQEAAKAASETPPSAESEPEPSQVPAEAEPA